ncbi:hypothetical protein EXIGLDRAFT_444441 [Exidia glandulosa HHB12029]|uniref:Uncharacterized protein n=1 Tax=Exidia glandulosa HHB12029 TaxID=1314781 RepID=A0A165B6B9_EXIGL|nr:hypothetical protein EXIGLDRAFT_444441 [Exidia glandulosa HHB12029]
MEGRKEREVHAPGTTHSRDKDGGAEGAGSATGEKDSKRRRETLTVLSATKLTFTARLNSIVSSGGTTLVVMSTQSSSSLPFAISRSMPIRVIARTDGATARTDTATARRDTATARMRHTLTHTYQLAAIAKTRTQRTGNFRNYWPIRARCPGSSSRLVYLARCRSRCVGLWRGRRRRVLRGLRGGGRRALASGNGEEALARGCGGGSVGERGWVWDKKVVERGGEEWKA